MSVGRLFLALLLALMVGSCWFTKCQWDECREQGFSRFYCWKHVS